MRNQEIKHENRNYQEEDRAADTTCKFIETHKSPTTTRCQHRVSSYTYTKLYMKLIYKSIYQTPKILYMEGNTVRHPLIKYHQSIIIIMPAINVTLKTTRTLGNTPVCEYVPGKSKLHLLWPRTRRGINSITSQIRWGQIRGMYNIHQQRTRSHKNCERGAW